MKTQTWIERTRQRMGELGRTLDDLRTPLGVKTRGAVGHYLAGRRSPSLEQLLALASNLECDFNWLITGQRVGTEPITLLSMIEFSSDLPASARYLLREIVLKVQGGVLQEEDLKLLMRLVERLSQTASQNSGKNESEK